MKAVILVAGKEKKFYPVTEKSHQCLLHLEDNMIIEKTLDSLASLNIKQVILVVGHRSELIVNKLGYTYKNMHLNYVKNEGYENKGTLTSLALVQDFVYNNKFLLIDGDVICDHELIHKLSNSDKENVLLVDFNKEISKGDMFVNVKNNKITEINRSKGTSHDKDQAVFIGISKISKDLSKKFFDTIEENSDKYISKMPYEGILTKLIPDKTICAIPTRGFNWIKVNQIEEFKNAKKLFGNLDILREGGLKLGADYIFKILPSELIFDIKAKMKCTTCDKYDKKHTCPPRVPNLNYKKVMNTYEFGLLILVKYKVTKENFTKIRKESTVKLHKILLDLEKKSFEMNNYYTISFIGGSCKLCDECGPICKHPKAARIPLESTGVDVIKTVKKYGISLKFPLSGNLYRVGLLLVG